MVDYSLIRGILGFDKVPSFTLSVPAEDCEEFNMRVALAQAASLNRIATALEELVQQGRTNRIDARRAARKGTR